VSSSVAADADALGVGLAEDADDAFGAVDAAVFADADAAVSDVLDESFG
jgi:hypothetical protein